MAHGFRLQAEGRNIVTPEIGLEFGHRAMLPLLRLAQERATLQGTEGRGLAKERSDGAIASHIFQDSVPVLLPSLPNAQHFTILNALQASSGQLRLSPQRFANWLAGQREKTDGLRTLDARAPRASKGNVAEHFERSAPLATSTLGDEHPWLPVAALARKHKQDRSPGPTRLRVR